MITVVKVVVSRDSDHHSGHDTHASFSTSFGPISLRQVPIASSTIAIAMDTCRNEIWSHGHDNCCESSGES